MGRLSRDGPLSQELALRSKRQRWFSDCGSGDGSSHREQPPGPDPRGSSAADQGSGRAHVDTAHEEVGAPIARAGAKPGAPLRLRAVRFQSLNAAFTGERSAGRAVNGGGLAGDLRGAKRI